MFKKIFFIVLLVAAVAGGFGLYQYYKPVSGLESVTPEFSLDAGTLYNDFLIDENAANEKYLGKVIEITGTVKNSTIAESGKYIVNIDSGDEMSGISCEVNAEKNPSVKDLKNGEQIKVKGVCSGILMDVVLVNCSIEKNK